MALVYLVSVGTIANTIAGLTGYDASLEQLQTIGQYASTTGSAMAVVIGYSLSTASCPVYSCSVGLVAMK